MYAYAGASMIELPRVTYHFVQRGVKAQRTYNGTAITLAMLSSTHKPYITTPLHVCDSIEKCAHT